MRYLISTMGEKKVLAKVAPENLSKIGTTCFVESLQSFRRTFTFTAKLSVCHVHYIPPHNTKVV